MRNSMGSDGAAAACGALAALAAVSVWRQLKKHQKKSTDDDDESPHAKARANLWRAIGGAMTSAQLYLGDRLGLYEALRELCADGRSTTCVALAKRTGTQPRWVREWLNQQAAAGFVVLLDGVGDGDDDLRYTFEAAYADVLADPTHPEYNVAMVQLIPCLVARAKTALPEAFRTGIGVSYNDPDISEAIDRNHTFHINEHFLKVVCPGSPAAHKMLEAGCKVADLGCGGGNLTFALAKHYPSIKVEGYEVSSEALTVAAFNLGKNKTLKNRVSFKDAREQPLGDSGPFDVVTTLDVLHDATDPAELIRQVKKSLKPGGVWLLADIACLGSSRENVKSNPAAALMYGFSTCLCLASALSEPGGAGLGTLGFTRDIAHKMIVEDAGFTSLRVISEADNTRWFEVLN